MANSSPKDTNNPDDKDATQAADVIRHKLDQLYEDEPSASKELKEAAGVHGTLSKHQKFMTELSQSGRSMAEIQTEWHNYYINLPDNEKRQVWKEFYDNYEAGTTPQPQQHVHHDGPEASKHHTTKSLHAPTSESDQRTMGAVKKQMLDKVGGRQKLEAKHHIQSLVFGLSMGALVVLILLFGFFNERFIAPFITPSRNVSSTPIIIDPSSTAVGTDPKIIIPKINVELPVVYTEPSIDEKAVQRSLETGVLHYATTPNPGELGNGVIFGHSSNNILNTGKYKFAFVMLRKLENGDTFMLEKDGKRYVYKVFDKKVVKPSDVSVLAPAAGKPATFTLITCDPPGTSLNRLVVTAEQISPDPAGNIASATSKATGAAPKVLPSNAPSLWSRFASWFSS